MKCPSCQVEGAYVGFSSIECLNPACVHCIPLVPLDSWLRHNFPQDKRDDQFFSNFLPEGVEQSVKDLSSGGTVDVTVVALVRRFWMPKTDYQSHPIHVTHYRGVPHVKMSSLEHLVKNV